ncbi:histidine-rich knob protein like KPRPC [Plasmodium vivax India VII]|uniref:Histidine-rich knob protein like KPRPC n=1 Tax=Plasmodium vivax India VII TaxID=1077284 RepID=A0A0J9V7V0_PLAVI|nr:histidine-rich knob protein like KPRPC [Plasmodium vivax India VII]
MATFKRYSFAEKINIFHFLSRTFFFSLLIWLLNCSNYQKCYKRRDQKDHLQNALHSTSSRSLSVVRRGGKYGPPLRTRVVKEVTRGGFKEYEEKYESKHYKLKENVEDGNKDCDEKYEAANYGFREKCPYEVNPYTGANGPDIFVLKKRFHQALNKNDDEEGEEDDEEGGSLKSKLPGSLDACEKGSCRRKKKRGPKTDDDYPTIIKEYEEFGGPEGYNGKLGIRGRRREYEGPENHRRHHSAYGLSPRGRHPVRRREHHDEEMMAYGPPPRRRHPGRRREIEDEELMVYGPPPRGRHPGKKKEHGSPDPSKAHSSNKQPQGKLKKKQSSAEQQASNEQSKNESSKSEQSTKESSKKEQAKKE